MAAYIVLEKRDAGGVREATFLRDGFRWLAFIVPTVWLLFHRLWIEAALAFAVTLVISVFAERSGMGGYASALTFLVSLYFGLEASTLQLRALFRRGWREWGVVEAPSLSAAELVYADSAGEIEDEDRPAEPVPAYHAPTGIARPPVAGIGLVPYPGR
jgi:hypothetical protein